MKFKNIILTLVASMLLFSCSNATSNSTTSNNSSSSTSTSEDSSSSNSESSSTDVINKYTITWKNYDGSILETDTDVIEGTLPTYDGETPTKPADGTYTYSFSGWTPTVVVASKDEIYTATYSSSKITYTINFDLNGGTSASYKGLQVVESFTKDVFFFDCLKDGFNFRGWSYNGEKIFDEDGNQLANPTLASTMTFVAEYSQTAKLTITSNMPSAGSVTGAGEYSYNSNILLSCELNQGYSFIGWYINNYRISSGLSTSFTISNKDIDIVAKFDYEGYTLSIETYNKDYGLVEINGNGETYLESDKENIKYQSSVTIMACSEKEASFLGWYDNENKLVSYDPVYTFTMPNHDYYLEAKWNYFTISYNLNGGTQNGNNPTSYKITDEVLTLSDPTKTGYTFLGWKYNDKTITSINPDWLDNIKLEAIWSANKYELSVTTEDGSKGTASITSGSGYSDESITVTATPEEDCVFKGWYIGDVRVSKDNPYTFNMPTNNYSLVAKFYTKDEEEELKKNLGITPVINEEGKTLTYGLYPQSRVSEPSTVVALENFSRLASTESNGWYFYNDEYYTKKVANPYDDSYTFDNGTTIAKGTTYWFKCEPIEWKILTNSDNTYSLVSTNLLDAHLFDDDESNNYKNSEIRSWLNKDFYNIAFSLNSSLIQTVEVDNSSSSTDNSLITPNMHTCDNTNDKVYLLSYKDYLNADYGFTTSKLQTNTRECRTTDYARANFISYSEGSLSSFNGFYWTRSPASYTSNGAWYITTSGYLNYSHYLDFSYYGVQPAITINF